MCVIAEVTTARGRVYGALSEGVFASERASARTCDVVVGEGAVFEGVTGGEVVMSKTSGTGSVEYRVFLSLRTTRYDCLSREHARNRPICPIS